MRSITLPVTQFKKFYKKYSDRELAIHFGVSVDQVRHYRRRYFISRTIKETRPFKVRAMKGKIIKVKL